MKITIVGGGAAGFMAAVTAAAENPNAEVVILEKNRTVLNKVRISGGGRCNVTNASFDHRVMAASYPRGERFIKKLLPKFDAQATVDWFAARSVVLKTEPDGRMFPESNSSETIINCLLREAAKFGVQIKTSTGIKSYFYKNNEANDGCFFLNLGDGEVMETDRLLICTGGHPKREGFDWLESHEIESPVPSLFTFNTPKHYLLPLMGVSVPNALVKIVGTNLEWRGPVLITHWGVSGPAVLKLSAWGARHLAEHQYRFTCKINWLPHLSSEAIRSYLVDQKQLTPKQLIRSHAHFGLPVRLWRAFLEQVEISDALRWIDISNKSLNRLVENLTNSQLAVDGKSTYKEEFVTAGGVSLAEIDQATLESKQIPGLYFAGEVLDVDGITGGFNFQNAWTTGYIAGKMISREIKNPIETL